MYREKSSLVRQCLAFVMMTVCAAPVCARNYDVVVVGGSSMGVAAAEAAADAGASVLLVEPRPYLGSDLAGKLRLKVEFNHDGWPPTDILETRLLLAYLNPLGNPAVITPLRIKQICEAKLLDKRIPFRTWTYPCGIVRDEDGNVAGVRIVSRSGFEIVGAKTLIDATEFGRLAEQAGSAPKVWATGLS
jgi:hypothetical protein